MGDVTWERLLQLKAMYNQTSDKPKDLMRPDGKPGKDSGTTTPEALLMAAMPMVKKLKEKAERAKEKEKSDDEEEPRKDDFKKDVEGSAATHSSVDGKPKRKRRKLVDTEKLALLLWRVILDHGGSCHADTLAEYAFRDWSLLAPSITSSSSNSSSTGQGITSSSNPQSTNKGESAAFRPIIPSRASLEDVKKLVHQALESKHQIPFASLYELSNPLYLYRPLYDLTLPKDSFSYNPIAQIALADVKLPSEVTSKAIAQILHHDFASLSSMDVSKEVPNGSADSTAQDDTSVATAQKESQEKGDSSSSQMNTDEPKPEEHGDGEVNKTNKAISGSEEIRDDTHAEESAIDLEEKAKLEELLQLEKVDRHTKDLRRVAFKPDPLLDGCFTLTGDSYAPPHIIGPPDSQMSSLVSALLPIMEVANNSLQLDRIAQFLIAQWSLLQAYPRQDVNIEMITHATHITLLTHPKFERDGSAQDEFFRIVSQSRRRRSTIPATGSGAAGSSSANAGANTKLSTPSGTSGNASASGTNASGHASSNNHHHHDTVANSSAAASSHAKHAASPSASTSATAKKGADSRTTKAVEPAARASTRLTDTTASPASTSNSGATQPSSGASAISAAALNAAASATLPSPSARVKRSRRGAEKETSQTPSSKAQATSPAGSKGSQSASGSSALGRSKWSKNGELLIPSQTAAPFHASVAAECSKFYGTVSILTARLRPGPGFSCVGCKTKKSERWFHGPNPSDWHCSTCGEAWSIEHTCPICGLVYENDDDDHDHSSSEEEEEEEDVESAASDDEGQEETHDEDGSDEEDEEDDEDDEESAAEKNEDHLASSSGMDVDASESDSKASLVKKDASKSGENAKMEVDGDSAAAGSSAPSAKNEDAGEEDESVADGKKDGDAEDDDELDDTNEESANTAGEARKRRKRRKSTFRKSTYPKASKSKAKRLKLGSTSSGASSGTNKTPSKSATSSSSKSPKTPSSSSKSSKSAKKSSTGSSSSRHSSRKSTSGKTGRSLGYNKKSKGKSSGSQSQGAQSSWIACDQCNRWVMSGCEGITDLSVYDDSNPNHLDYHCSICRGLLGAMPSVFYTKSTAKFFVGDLKDAKRYVSSGQFLKDMNAVLATNDAHMDVSDPSDASAVGGDKDSKEASLMAISSPSSGASKAADAKATGANNSKKTTARTAAAAATASASTASAAPAATAAAFSTPKQAAAKHVSPVSAAPRNGATAGANPVASPVPAPDLGRGARRGGATANVATPTSAMPNPAGAQTSPAEINRTAALNDPQAQPKAHNGTAPNNGWNFSGPASAGGAIPSTPNAEPALNFVHPTTPVAHLTLGMHPLSTPVFVLNARLAAALDPNVTFGRIESEMLRLAETTLLGQQQQLKAAFDLAMLQAEEAEVRQKANGPTATANGESASNGETEPTTESAAAQDASSSAPPSAMDVSQSPAKAVSSAAAGEEARAQNGPIPSRPLPPLSEKSKQSLALLEQRFQEEVLNMRSLMANSMAHIMDQHRLDSERAILALLEEREQLDAQAERIILEQFQQFSAVKTRQLLAKTLSLYQTECPALHSAALPPLPPGTIPNPTTSIFASAHPSTNGDYSAQLQNIALATQRPSLAPQPNGTSDDSSTMDLDTVASALAGSQPEAESTSSSAGPSAVQASGNSDNDTASPSTTVHLQHLPHKVATEKTSAPSSPARKSVSEVSRSAPSSAPGSPKKSFGRTARDSSFLNQGLQSSAPIAPPTAPAAPPQPTEAELAAQRQREEEEKQKREEEERLQKEAEAARIAAEEEEAAKKAAEEAKRRSEADAKISESLWPTEDNETFGGPPAIIDAPAADPSAVESQASTENADQAVPSEEGDEESGETNEDVSAFISKNPSSMDVDANHTEESDEKSQGDASDNGAAESEMALD